MLKNIQRRRRHKGEEQVDEVQLHRQRLCKARDLPGDGGCGAEEHRAQQHRCKAVDELRVIHAPPLRDNAQAAEAASAVLCLGKARGDKRTHEREKDSIDERELIEIEHIAVFQGEAPALPGITAIERPRAGRGGQGKRRQENITAAVFEVFGFQQGGHRLRSFPVISRKISSSVFPSSISCRRSSSP